MFVKHKLRLDELFSVSLSTHKFYLSHYFCSVDHLSFFPICHSNKITCMCLRLSIYIYRTNFVVLAVM